MNARHAAPARSVDQPEPGFFTLRLVKGGPKVPARIIHAPATDPLTGETLDRSYWWSAEISGKPAGEPSMQPTDEVMRIWLFGEPITEADYRYEVADMDWCLAHAPAEPKANPRQRIDLASLPALF